VFTTLAHALVQAAELHGIESWAYGHLHPIYGSIFHFSWRKDNDALQEKKTSGLEDGEEDSVKLWFTN
jgi:hypothetical protein